MKFNPRYPLKHLSIRIPWHDSAWNGTICQQPQANSACLALRNCALKRDDEKEQRLAGMSLKVLNEPDFPICVEERATFMADFAYTRTLKHPYAFSSRSTHGHLKPTVVTFPAYSAAAVPYNWMLKGGAKAKSDFYALNFDEGREPQLEFKSGDNWVQEYDNQRALLDCFFEHFDPGRSLVFFYLKEAPFVEGNGRVLAGVGRIHKIVPSEKYDGSNKRFGAAYWEHMILHGIRPNAADGFLLPYHAAIAHQAEHPDCDMSKLAVVIPNDQRLEFSYAAEHVSSDNAVRVLLQCLNALELAEADGIGQYNRQAIKWIHDEIAALEKLRGPYPGMGSALCAFGIDKGHFVAAEIVNKIALAGQSPWDLFEQALDESEGILSEEVARLIPFNTKSVYKRLKSKTHLTRIDLLHLLSRFDLSIAQATMLFVAEERSAGGLDREEKAYLENPFLIYEDLRHTTIPVALETIDLGLYAKAQPYPLYPAASVFTDPYDLRRLRALTLRQLEFAATEGHTLLPQSQVITQIRALKILPKCEVNSDYFELAEDAFVGVIVGTAMKKGEPAYQLERFAHARAVIAQKIDARVGASRLHLEADWAKLIDEALAPFMEGEPDEQEKKARREKVAALQEIAESRFSVLIGPAGTGKTTLLTILAAQPEVEEHGVLLLAPTGKARVRMAEVAKGSQVIAKTLAQFLADHGRYKKDTQRYVFSNQSCDEQYDTVILDEASMLTEEMLATTLECLKSVRRFVLVGDHRQLPPIGAGRPFVDIIQHLRPEGLEVAFPRIGKAYAELTIKRRQGGSKRADIQLAEWFSGEPLEPGADAVIDQLVTRPDSDCLRIEHWRNERDFEELFERVLTGELGMASVNDLPAFNMTLGAKEGKYYNLGEAIKKVEDWQILSPVKAKEFGVKLINRRIHRLFRAFKVAYALNRDGNIPAPIGLEQIVHGDKVINVSNSWINPKNVYPPDGSLNYLANGEIGLVIGQHKQKYHTFKGQPKNTEIEFSTQKGYKYTFRAGDFDENGDAPLELAYALTVHKAQGSEFKKVFLIIPNPCLLLSREMLYTALTRQKDKVIILMQGSSFDIKAFSAPSRSDTLRRITNLFEAPDLIEFEGKYLERNLIHQAGDGTMLRSKSEQMIYQRLLDKGLDPVYEKKLTIKGVDKLPDFTIRNDDTGEVYYWEHCGMLYDKDYEERWEEKYAWYIQNDIRRFEDGGGPKGILIISEDKPFVIQNGAVRGAISIMEIDERIKQIFNR